GAGADELQDLGMLARELVGEPYGLLAHGAAIAADSRGVAAVRERRDVEEHGGTAERGAQHQVEVVEDAEARVERPGTLERAARKAHALELAEVPAEDV